MNVDYEELHKITSGHVVSIFSTDIEKIPIVIIYIANCAASIYAIIMVSIIVGYLHGLIPALTCFLSTILMITVQSLLAFGQGSLRKDIAEKSDKRIFFMNEILSGIETIKMQVWEEYFKKNISILRKWEIRKYMDSFLYKIVYKVINMIGMRFPLILIILSQKFTSSQKIDEQSLIYLIVLLLPFEFDIVYLVPELMFMLKELFKSLQRIEVYRF